MPFAGCYARDRPGRCSPMVPPPWEVVYQHAGAGWTRVASRRWSRPALHHSRSAGSPRPAQRRGDGWAHVQMSAAARPTWPRTRARPRVQADLPGSADLRLAAEPRPATRAFIAARPPHAQSPCHKTAPRVCAEPAPSTPALRLSGAPRSPWDGVQRPTAPIACLKGFP